MRMLVRVLAVLLLALPAAAWAQLPVQVGEHDVYARARLILVERSPGCGNIVFGSRALYAVEEGPDGLKGGPLEVVVPCIEMPMTDWQGVGDLKNFIPGDIHYLRISRDNVRQVEAYDDMGGRAWHLLAASLRPLAGAEASAPP